MSEHMMREYYDRMESAKKKLAEETNRFLDILMERPDEYAESIEVLRSFQRILDSSDFLHIDWLIWNEEWRQLDRILSDDVRRILEEVRRIEIRQESARALEAASDWYARKRQYLDCAEEQLRSMGSEIRRCMWQSECYSASPPAAPKPKAEKKPSWWERLFKRKASARKPEPLCPAAMRPEPFYPSAQMRDESIVSNPRPGAITQADPHPVTVDEVFFTAMAPKEFQRDEYTDVAVAMYEDAYRDIVDRIRETYDGQVARCGTGAMPVAKQTPIRVTIESPEADICFDNTEATGIWIGKSLEFHFWVLVPEDFQKKQFKLIVQVFTDDVPFTTLTLFVKCNASSTQEIAPERRDIRSAFVSYARADTDEVTTLIRGMEKIRPDLNVFMDQESLRSGQNWQEVLKAEIEQRDVLFLCWSPEAKASEWVDFEWRHMYNKRGIEHINPVPLVSPQSCPPPTELSMLHFDDRWLHYRKRQEPVGPEYFYIKNHSDGRVIPVRKNSILIGREKDVDLCLQNTAVSRHHMVISLTETGSFQVRDMNSKNGSYLEGKEERITPTGIIVKHGTKLRLANEIIEIL